MAAATGTMMNTGRVKRPDTAHVLVGHQPAYLPWPGYFSRLLDVDRFLLLDHVGFSARSWQQRNTVRGPRDERHLLTVPVLHRLGQPINQVRIADDRWRGRHWRILQQAYRHAPFWAQWEPRLRAIYDQPWQHLAPLNLALTRLLLDGLGIDVEIMCSSDLAPAGHKTELLIDLCRRTGASVLRVGSGAPTYLDTAQLAQAGIGVEVATYIRPASGDESASGPGLPGLSALDLLLHCGPDSRQVLAAGSQIQPWPLPEAVTA